MANTPVQVGIIMGSAADADTLRPGKELLEEFGIAVEIRAFSAHRSPAQVLAWVSDMEKRGAKVLIASAGMAAHLAGVVAANTTLPVLGVPVAGGVMDGLDSLLSTVQMPKGTPVATFAVGKAGAINAALFAVRILAVKDDILAKKVKDHKERLTQEVIAADEKLQKEFNG